MNGAAAAIMATRVSEDEVDDYDLFKQFLEGHPKAFSRLYRRWSPAIRSQAMRMTRRFGVEVSTDEILDYVQAVWLHLIEKDFRILRGFDPQYPRASLKIYVKNLAAWRTLDGLRSLARRPLSKAPEWFEALADEPNDEGVLEREVAEREYVKIIYERLEYRLGPRGRKALAALFIDNLTAGEAARRTGMSTQALYSWRRDIRRMARRIREEL